MARSGLTRRRFIGGTALAAAFAAMPPHVRRAIADPVPPQAIEHVVLLMQENRSFDHYFGTMAGVRGFGDPNAIRLPNGASVFEQPDPENPDGHTLPFHLDTYTNSVQKIPSTSHAWLVQHEDKCHQISSRVLHRAHSRPLTGTGAGLDMTEDLP